MKLLELTHTHGCIFEQMDLRHGRIQAQFADHDDQGSPPVRFERRQYHVIVIGYFRAVPVYFRYYGCLTRSLRYFKAQPTNNKFVVNIGFRSYSSRIT